LGWEKLEFPDLAPSDCHLFLALSGRRFTCDEVERAAITFLMQQDIR
jgi:hypothetical protein